MAYRGNQEHKTHLYRWSGVVLMLTLLAGQIAWAQDSTSDSRKYRFDIPAQPLMQALRDYTAVTGRQVVIPTSDVSRYTSSAVSGTLPAEAALIRLAEDTGLAVRPMAGGSFSLIVSDLPEPASARPIEEVFVYGQREYLYRADGTDSLGFNTPLSRLPAVVNVVTEDFIEDTVAYDLEDLINYVPGVVNGGYDGGPHESLIIRGFDNSARFVNGVRQYGFTPQRLSFENIERIEFVKGPAGVEFAGADPGGSVNFVTKKPRAKFAAQTFVGGGDFGYRRLGGDVTGPITQDESLRYRLIGGYSERPGWRDGQPDEMPRWTLAPSLAWDYAAGGNLLLEYQHTYSDEPNDRGIWYLEGAGFDANDNFAPREFSFHNVDDKYETTSDRYEVKLSQELGDRFGIDVHAQVYRADTEVLQVEFAPIRNAYTDDGLTWDGVTTDVSFSMTDWLTDYENDNISAVLRADFTMGSVAHRFRLGLQRYDTEVATQYGIDGDGVLQVSNTINIFRPDNEQELIFTGRNSNRSFVVTEEIGSVFGQWLAEVSDRLRIVAGLRFDDVEFFSQFENATDLFDPQESFSDEISFRLAASYDVSDSVTAFAGYADSHTPQSGVTRAGDAIEPLHNVSYEAGVKSELFGTGVLWTNTIYQLTRDNIAAADPDDPTNTFSIPFGKVRIRGFESEFIGTVSTDLDLSAAVTLQDSENVRTEDPSVQGNEFINVPDLQVSAFANYRFDRFGLSGCSARLGVMHVAERPGSPANNFQLPSYTRVDLGARYVFDERLSFDIFVENLFDENYIEQAQGRTLPENGIIPGDRRQVQFNIRYSL